VKFAEQEVFWRYFVSQVLRLSLMLICEDIPETLAGLILPFGTGARFINDPKDLSTLREVLVGWQEQNGSFDTFLDSAPFFEHSSDFRIEPLVTVGEENKSHDLTMIIIQREAAALDLSLPLVQTIRRLMAQIYDNVSQWKSAFNDGKRDYLYQATDFSNNAHPSDKVLDTLMNMVIQLGGKFAAKPEQDRWKFCCLLLPQDNALPVQQRSLTVQAQSTNSPYKLGINVESTKGLFGLSLRAYQSGNIIYEPDIVVLEAISAYSEQEKSTRSAIALPIIREDGLSIAVLYLASDKAHAFPVEDQRVLRLIGTMIEELLLTYHARQQAWGKRTYLIDKPEIVDPAFQDFFTENDFICDLEKLLETVQAKDASKYTAEEEVSFIAIDIDNQSTFATHYGDRVARNLSLEVGTRLQEHLKLFAKLNNKPLYHLNADRYFLLLDGMSLDDARKNAEQIRIALKDKYLVDAQRFSSKGTKLPTNMLGIPELSVRLGVTSYTCKKLEEILHRYPSETSIVEVKDLIMGSLDTTLSIARREGGNNIVSWDPTIWGYAPWSPSL
jgi:GGDEF domain-containing protein